MATITKQQYAFLLSIGVPFEGWVEGVGRAITKPVNVASSSPACGAISMGTFYSTNYVAAIIPETTKSQVSADNILNKIIKVRADGSHDVLDVKTKRTIWFGNNIKTNVKIDTNQNLLSIHIEDTNGNKYETVTELDEYLAEIGDKPVSPLRIAFDTFGAAFNYSRFRFEGMKTNQKSKLVHDSYQYMKKKWSYKPGTKPGVMYNQRIPKFYKYGGRVLVVVSVGILTSNIYDNRAVKASHVLDGAMLSIAAIPPYGWVAGLSYFIIDAGVTIFTDKSIGDYLNEYLHENSDIKDGILWDISPYFK